MTPPIPRPPSRPAAPATPARTPRPARPRRPRLRPPAPANPGPSTVPTPSLFAGVDCEKFPGSPPGFLRELVRHSNVDWMAMYLQPTPSAGLGPLVHGHHTRDRGWMDKVETLRDEGLGVLPVYVGEQSPTVSQGRLSKHPSAAHGRRDAADAAALLQRAGFEAGSVVYLDIERAGNAEAIEPEVFEYMEEFCRGVTRQGFRPGLYTPFQMARALVARWPSLYAWVVNVSWTVPPLRGLLGSPSETVDPLGRRRAEVIIARPPIARSRRFRQPHPNEPDRDDNRYDFPPLWQYRIEHQSPIPVLPRQGQSQPGPVPWDFSASIVRDPSLPVCEPRLAVATGRADVLALGSLAPPRSSTGDPVPGGRTGELWTSLPAAPDPAHLPPECGSGVRLHPWSRPSAVAEVGGGIAVATLLEDRTPAVFAVSGETSGRWTRAKSLGVQIPPRLRPRSGVHLARLGDRLFLAGISEAGAVLVGRRSAQGLWEEAMAFCERSFRAHPLSELALVGRGADVIDLFAIGADGLLYNLYWARWDQWPGEKMEQIGGTRVQLRPDSPIAVAVARRALDVFVFGQDGMLYVTSWWQDGSWTPLLRLGDRDFRPSPLARPAAVVRGDEASTDLFVVDSRGELATLWRPGGQRVWPIANVRRIGGSKQFPHQLTDLAVHSPDRSAIEVTLIGHDGRPLKTQWSTNQDWTDFAPVNLPAFAAPDP